MTARQRSGLVLGLLWAVAGVILLGFQGGPADRATQGGGPSIRRTRPEIARLGRYPREEWFVRDVYARLMRYDHAARQVVRVDTGVVPGPDAYLGVFLRNIRTQDVGTGGPVAPPGASAVGAAVVLRRMVLCHQEDPCHASYAVAWGDATAAAATVGAARTFAGPVTRVTTYEVTLTLAGQTRTYTAQVRYHDTDDGVSVEPEVLDPVMPSLQQVADDDAPLAVAPWARYVQTRRYAAVVKRLADLRRAGRRAVPDRAPIGTLPGDGVTAPLDALVIMSAGEPCQNGECAGREGQSCSSNGQPGCWRNTCVNGACDRKQIQPLTPYPPGSYPWTTDNMTADTLTALTCLENLVTRAGGSVVERTSGWRPQAYQDHLYEIYSKAIALQSLSDAACTAIKTDVMAEKAAHQLNGVVAPTSYHTAGTAFDVTVSVPDTFDLDGRAQTRCGLVRDAGETWHWHYVGR